MSALEEKVRLVGLAVAGVLLAGGLVWLHLLFMNAPTGFEPISWLARRPIAVYTASWHFPVWVFSPHRFSQIAIGTIAVLWIVYLWAVVGLAQPGSAPSTRRTAVVVIGFAAAAQVLLTLLPPVFSNDLYHYVMIGRMVAVHHLNPYVTLASAVPADPFSSFDMWPVASHYGPLFTWLCTGAALLGGDSFIRTTILFKAMAAAFHLASCVLIYRLTDHEKRSDPRPLALYAWNPLILLESAGSGHTEVTMMTFALLGLLLVARGRPVAGVAALAASVAIKYVTAVLLGLIVVHRLARQENARASLRLAAYFVGIGAVVWVALFIPLWEGPRTLAMAAGLLLQGPSLVGLPASPGLHVRLLAFAAFSLVFAILATRVAWPWVLALASVVTCVFALLVFGWIFPWYFIPALTLSIVFYAARPGTKAGVAILAANLVLSGYFMLHYGVLTPVGN